MRILLIQPPLVPSGPVQPPLGLCTLAAWLTVRGHEAALLDLDLERRERGLDGEAALLSLVEDRVRALSPDVVGVTSMFSNSLNASRIIARAKRAGAAVTVAGGSHFGALPDLSLARVPELDFVVAGEGEIAILSLLEALRRGDDPRAVAGLAFRDQGTARANPPGRLLDLAELPNVWRTLAGALDVGRYAALADEGPLQTIYIEAGRGCPYACSFCATAPFWRHKFRVRPPQTIVEEAEYLHRHAGYDGFILVHDLLTIDRRFMFALCEAFSESQLPLRWMANTRADIDLEGLLPKMRAAGAWKLFMGTESGAPALRRTYGKPFSDDDIVRTVAQGAAHGLDFTCSFIIGFPEEQQADLARTVALAARLKLEGAETVQLHRLRLWPPAPLASQLDEAEFDAASVGLEYPFAEVGPADGEAIAGDRAFFPGYFSLPSAAGNFDQLAQAELFFHHAVALAPLTVLALTRLAGERLVALFYRAAAARPLQRAALAPEGGRVDAGWAAIRPVLAELVETAAAGGFARRLLDQLFDYESQRLAFLFAAGTPPPPRRDAEFAVSIADAIDALREAAPLDEALERSCSIVFRRDGDGTVAAYQRELEPA